MKMKYDLIIVLHNLKTHFSDVALEKVKKLGSNIGIFTSLFV